VIWFKIRKASIDAKLRLSFERYGVAAIQQFLVGTGAGDVRFEGKSIWGADLQPPMLEWLTEQYDRAERKETWTITMEVTICALVAAELIFSVMEFVGKK
jgi:hypothetical protein